jgi:hypothetical protein
VPEGADGWVCIAPLPDDGLDLRIGAAVVAGNAAPGSDRAAESCGQVGGLALLPFGRRDGADVLAQHLRCDHAVGLKRLVAACVILPVGI